MVRPSKRLLKFGILLMCMVSISIIWIRITGEEYVSTPVNAVRKAFVVGRREYQLLAEISLPEQGASANNPLQDLATKASSTQTSMCNVIHDHQEDCEVMHLLITSWGTNVTRSTAILLKSIFLYRKNPLHLHILADQMATVILTELLRSWRLFEVSYTFYNLEELQAGYGLKDFSKQPEGRLFIQLALPDILPVEVAKVIIINSDRMLTADLGDLWSVFRRFGSSQSIALVTGPGSATVNVGVMIMHTVKLRVIQWSQKLDILKRELNKTPDSTLLEQTAANLLLELFPDLVYRLPGQYNYPKVDTTMSCSAISANHVKVIEFDGDRVPACFWKAFLKIVRYDGNLLRKPTGYACSTNDESDYENDEKENTQQMKLVDTFGNDFCKDYVRELVTTFRTHLFFLGSGYNITDELDVTMVTQLSINRIYTLEKLCKQWRGPMSIAIYLSDSDVMHLLSYIQNSKVLAARNNIVFHLLYEDGSLYPTNHLRNTAVSQVKTSHVFVLDVDFLPNPSLYDDFREAIKLHKLKAEKLTLLVPAFETDDYSIVFPDTKQKVIPLLDTGVIYPFRNKSFVQGHHPTNYSLWKRSSEPYKVSWQEDFEPYFAMLTEDLPKYRENFMGYGMNKIVHIMEVAARGFSFLVMPNSYVLHLPHAETFERVRHASSMDIIRCMKMLEEDVARELLAKYGNESLHGWRPTMPAAPLGMQTTPTSQKRPNVSPARKGMVVPSTRKSTTALSPMKNQ